MAYSAPGPLPMPGSESSPPNMRPPLGDMLPWPGHDIRSRPSVASHTSLASPYQTVLPSAPPISGPMCDKNRMCLTPEYERADSTLVAEDDFRIITQNKMQVADDRTQWWQYENRRNAQSITDFLQLGPALAIRDFEYLRSEGITMVLIVRHASMASQKMMSAERVTAELGIDVQYVHAENDQQLMRIFPDAIRAINNHLVSVCRGSANARRGKVLVACDSGNSWSAAIVAAYLMAIFGADVHAACNFVTMQRFCSIFTDVVMRGLQTWQDMIKARTMVAQGQGVPAESSKRRIDSVMEMDDAEGLPQDHDRYVGREKFMPFS
jgi:serine/threonine/tyrosine-interacting protein